VVTTEATTMAVLERDTQAERVSALEALCGEIYQVASALGAPARVLDQLWAAAQGDALPHATVLPFHVRDANPVKAAAVLGSRGGLVRTDAKATAAIRNGRLGGRPRIAARHTRVARASAKK
jgi:hypothetical protein